MPDLSKLSNAEFFDAICRIGPGRTFSRVTEIKQNLYHEYLLRISGKSKSICNVVYFNEDDLTPWCVNHQKRTNNWETCTDARLNRA